MSGKLQITTFGGLSIQIDGQQSFDFASRKVEALLVYLTCSGRALRREALAELLWEERSQERAMGNLRVALTSLRKELEDYVLIDRETVAINPDADVWLDAAELEEMLAAGQIEQAVALYPGPFLEGFYVREARGFEDWVAQERGRLERLVLDALSAQVARDLESGAFKVGIEHASQLLGLDPLREDAHHKLMLLLACSGQRSAALAQYETCRGALADELGVEPSPELRETYDLLVKGQRPAGIPEVPSARDRRLEAIGECPYRGLAAFREDDAPFFFGRGAFTERLHAAVMKQPMVAVIVGSSGSGKSSAVFAGLLPRLREAGDWLIADFRPGVEPFQTLASRAVALLEPEMSRTDRLVESGKLASALKAGEVSLHQVAEQILEGHPGKRRLLLIADQFEELYTLCPEAEARRSFLDLLLEAVQAANDRHEPRFVLLLTMRADFMGQALAHRPFADALQEAALIMGPMNREELRVAIEKPAELQGAAFEAGLVERLLDDVGQEPGNLPLLEFALTLLWERISYGWMTHAGYEEIGRVEGALARYARQVYEGLDAGEQEQARHIFIQLVHPGEGTEDTRRLATQAEVGETNWGLVQRLADKRLVVTGRDPSGSETVEVVHEALIQGWGQLRGWIDEDRAFRTWQERLRGHLRQWRDSGEDEGALLRGAPLAEAEGWGTERGDELSQAEKEYIRAGVALREQRQMERERRRRRVLVGLAVGFVLALALALLAGGQWRRAEGQSAAALTARALEAEQRSTAQAASTLAVQGQEQAMAQEATAQSNAQARATAQADAERQRDVAEEQRYQALRQTSISRAAQVLNILESGMQDTGVLLALDALENYPPTWQAEQALGQAVLQSHLRLVLPHEDQVYSIKWSPDGKRLLTSTVGAFARVWDATNGEQLLELEHDEDGVVIAIWSPDGERILTSAGPGGKLHIWDALTGEKLHTLEGHTDWVNYASWSPTGDRIISASDDLTAKIWDAQTGQEIHTLSAHKDWVYCTAWSPDGEKVLTASRDHSAIVWNPTTGEPLVTLSDHTTWIRDCWWSPSGDRILTSSQGGTTIVWDPATGEALLTLSVPAHQDRPVFSQWSPSGDRILAGGAGEAPGPTVYDAQTGEELYSLYPGNPSVWLVALAWSPSGDRILTGTRDGSVTLWDAASGEELYTLRGHSAEITSDWSVAWSPDGRRVATGSVDGTAMIWDTAPVFKIEGHNDIVHAFWSPTDDRILSGEWDGVAKIWDARTGVELLKVYGAEIPLGENWSPSGDRFSIGVKTGETKIWDATSGDNLLTLFIPGYSGRDKRWSVPAWSPDGTRIATCYDYGAFVNIWDATSGEELLTVRGFTHERSETFWVEWSPSSDRILTVDQKEFVKVWDATTGEKVLDISDFENVVPIADWSPDGSRIATLTYENDGAIWDAQSGEKLAEFYGHQGSTFGLRWSPSGERLVTGSYDGTVRVWDAESGQQVLHYPIGYKINKVDWSHDGSKLLITYADKIIVLPVWQTTQELVDYAHDCCVVRELTPEERELYGLPPSE